jgi:hypothetical protein
MLPADPREASEDVALGTGDEHIFVPTRLSGTPSGTTIADMGINDEIFDVTKDELPKNLKADFEKAIHEYELKLLLSYGRTRNNKVFQKTKFPRTLLDGLRDPDVVNAQHEMSETIGRAMSETLNNHNQVFINSLTKRM